MIGLDVEASGTHTEYAQPFTYAAVEFIGDPFHTNRPLALGELFSARCRRQRHVLLSPGAARVTGLSFTEIDNPELPSMRRMMESITDHIRRNAGNNELISLAYNGINYDSRLLANSAARTLQKINFLTDAPENRRAGDLLRMTRLYCHLYPDALDLPTKENGKVILKLDTLLPHNRALFTRMGLRIFEPGEAHNEVSDVEYGLFPLANLIKLTAPRLWDRMLRNTEHKLVELMLSGRNREAGDMPGVFYFINANSNACLNPAERDRAGRYVTSAGQMLRPADRSPVTSKTCDNPDIKWRKGTYSALFDIGNFKPDDYLHLSVKDLSKLLKQKKAGTKKKKLSPFIIVNHRSQPMLLPVAELRQMEGTQPLRQRAQVSDSELKRRAALIADHPEFMMNVGKALAIIKTFPEMAPDTPPELQTYSHFALPLAMRKQDEEFREQFNNSYKRGDWHNCGEVSAQFHNPTWRLYASVILAEEGQLSALPVALQRDYVKFVRDRLEAPANVEWSSFAKMREELAEEIKRPDLSKIESARLQTYAIDLDRIETAHQQWVEDHRPTALKRATPEFKCQNASQSVNGYTTPVRVLRGGAARNFLLRHAS